MNTSGSAYTHLESLRLFQYLHAYGVNPSVFASISDLLTKDPDVTSNKYFQPGRLSPDALRNFYLDRLRKEIEYEQNVDPETGNGDVINAKKRKLPVAPLPSVQESLQHQHLIPKLVTKLYASYRKDITEQIRQDEERYDALLREVQSIEAGEWNDHLKEKLRASASRSPTSSKKSPLVAQKPSPANNEVSRQNGTPGAPGDATLADNPPPNGQSTSSPTSPRRKQTSVPPPRPSSATQPLAASPVPPNSQPQTRIQQPPQQPNQPYNAPPNFPPYPPGPQLHPPQSSPHQHAAHLPNRQSPVMGPHGPQFQHPSPVYSGNGPPPYPPGPGGPQAYLPPQQRYPYQQSPGPQSPGVQPVHPQRSPYAQPGMPPYVPLQPQMGQHPPPQAGFMLPPFQVAPQDPSRVHPQTTTPSQPPQVSTPSSNRQQPRSNMQTPVVPRPGIAPAHPLVNQARQPFATPVSARSPLSAVGTPTSARSLWKRQSLPASAGSRASPRPEPEPIDDFEPLVRPKTSPAKPKSQRKPRGKGKGKEKEAEQESAAVPETTEEVKPSHEREEEEDDAANEMETRSGRTTRRKAAPKRTRARSIASSRAAGSVRGRSRSQSVLSHTETVAADNESQAGNRIKSERGTSADVMEEDHIGTPSQVSTRRRGAATQAASSTRRKRNAREASLEEAEDHFSTPGPLKSVIAQRGFSRMCDPIMNDIKSHRHASTFTSAVRAKDAEGYYDIIKRPTDLKTIQKAIAFGSKQVAAAASTDTPVGSPGGNGAIVELPMTLENIPPKSIVNASQLEKELMRMFVNAVMFNPGEEGVVEDAREMFESVGRSVSTWRNVERGAGSGSGGARTEAEETPAAEEEAVSQVSKRQRKL